MTTVINMNAHPVQVRVDTANGVDYVHVMSKSRVKLPSEVSVNSNWLASNANIKVVAPADTLTSKD